MKEKHYKANELYIVRLCRFDNNAKTNYVDRFFIATKTKAGIIKDSQFILLTHNNVKISLLSSFHRETPYAIDDFVPLPLYAKNLPDKIPYSLIVKLEKEINDYHSTHKNEIINKQSKTQNNDYGDDLCC